MIEKMPTAVDVFAGGGGLTVGLKRAGFRVVAAIELEEHAFATYKVNHPDVGALRQDVCTVRGRELASLTACRQVDLLAGCPPCQGFTSLTAKWRRSDPRDNLIMEMARLVEELKPRAVMMENVPRLRSKGKSLYAEFKAALNSRGYVLTEGLLQVADFGVPQLRKRIVLLAGLGFEIPLPQPTHAKDGRRALLPWRTVREAIGHLGEPRSMAAFRCGRSPERSDWHVVRVLSAENVARIKAARPGGEWSKDIPEHLRPLCHQGGYVGFRNVYGRMQWDEPAPTITGGCTTFSKGRFGHPESDRTISVREAALLQTLPEDYRIDTPYIDHACEIVGNALPCLFAEAVARQCIKRLTDSSEWERNYRESDRPPLKLAGECGECGEGTRHLN